MVDKHLFNPVWKKGRAQDNRLTSSHLAATEGGSAQELATPIAPARRSQMAPSVHSRDRNKEERQIMHRKLCLIWSKAICTIRQLLEETFNVGPSPGQL